MTSAVFRGLFGAFSRNPEVRGTALRSRLRSAFDPSLSGRGTIETDSCLCHCGERLRGDGFWLASRWTPVFWRNSERSYLHPSEIDAGQSLRHNLEAGAWVPAADDCVALIGDDDGLELFSSCSGASRLYTWWQDEVLYFADSLSLFSVSREAPIDKLGLGEILRFGSNNTPRTLLGGIDQIPFAHRLRLSGYEAPDLRPYRDYSPCAESGLSEVEVLDRTEQELSRSIRAISRRAEIFMSGGVDSALLGSIGSRSDSLNNAWFMALGPGDPEEEWAQKAADACGLSLRRLDLDLEWEALERTVRAYSHPTLDFSVLPTHAIGRGVIEASGADLIIDGTGGDAWFGFESLGHAATWQKLSPYQPWLQKLASGLYAPLIHFDRVAGMRAVRTLCRASVVSHAGVAQMTVNPVYRQLLPLGDEDWYRMEADVVETCSRLSRGAKQSPEDEMLLVDATMVAINQFAAKSSQWALSRQCQTHYPFLMPNVVDLARSIPNELKQNASGSKRILKELVARTPLGSEFAHRRKVGFQPPLERLFAGRRDLLARLMNEDDELSSILSDGAYRIVDRILRSDRVLTTSERYCLWAVVMLKVWIRNLRSGALSP